MEMKPKQAVYRIGLDHNKWLCVMPPEFKGPYNVIDVLPHVKKELENKFGASSAVIKFDHVEFLGMG